MEKMDEKLIPIIEENKNLKTKVEKLEKEIDYLKRAEKNNNIIDKYVLLDTPGHLREDDFSNNDRKSAYIDRKTQDCLTN
ncbi:unnamed protein product [Leptidea sinapis]|uniref:Uncharacterized protein n=1 Tax=Leptidea sinapis TaxID=189913 RepID=A0A5E4PVY1_9NEOP|nr:unnamed protein product [Leptidea sinapis]